MGIKVLIITLISTIYLSATQLDTENKDYIGNTLKILENSTPEQEFLLGKRLASEMITDKMYYSKSARVKYLNSIVNSLVLSSDRPYVFDGYKVILLRNKSFNAHAYPGGIIVVNDGIFKYLKNEDQLAAILAHEIGHIQEKHNVGSDKGYKISDAMTIASIIGVGKNIDNGYAQAISMGVFSGLTDSVLNGYDVEQEAEADELGMKLMAKAGYDPDEFINTLKKLKEVTSSYGGAKYPKDRLERLEKLVASLEYSKEDTLKTKKMRTRRYKKYD